MANLLEKSHSQCLFHSYSIPWDFSCKSLLSSVYVLCQTSLVNVELFVCTNVWLNKYSTKDLLSINQGEKHSGLL